MNQTLYSGHSISGKISLKERLSGIGAFMFVLLAMPLGHTLMVLMDSFFDGGTLFAAAFALGAAGVVILFISSRAGSENLATMGGLFAGLFIWTGWIEFSFVFIASHLEIEPLRRNGEIITKPEYLVMMSSAGLLCFFLVSHFFDVSSNCNFFRSLRSLFRIKKKEQGYRNPGGRNYAVVTASELVLILWTFYIVLLFVYDESFFGEKHFAAYLTAFGSLLWSLFLFKKLLKIRKPAYAIRYAIPVVIIFWNFVEILGRWNLLKEIWIHPLEYQVEIAAILFIFLLLAVPAFRKAGPGKIAV